MILSFLPFYFVSLGWVALLHLACLVHDVFILLHKQVLFVSASFGFFFAL